MANKFKGKALFALSLVSILALHANAAEAQKSTKTSAKKEQSTAKNAPKTQANKKAQTSAQNTLQNTSSAQKPKNAQNDFPNHQIFLGAGILNGLSLGYRYNVIPELAVRADVNYLGYSADFDQDNVTLEADLKNLMFGVYADYFPFGKGFFLSGGLVFNSGDFVSAKAKPSAAGSITINDHTYQYGPEDHIKASIKFPAVRPYLGLGYAQRYENGFGFNFDLGAAIGKPKANFDISDSLYQKNQTASGAGYDFRSDIDKLESDINDYAKKYATFYPMIRFSISYAF